MNSEFPLNGSCIQVSSQIERKKTREISRFERDYFSATVFYKIAFNVKPNDVHVILGENLPPGTKTIDRVVFRDGVVESQKSIDLSSPTYQAPGALESRLSGCVHDLEIYRGQMKARAGFQMDDLQVQEKILHIGIKDGSMTAEQKAVFDKVGKQVQDYNDKLLPGKAPITLKVTVVK